VKFKCNYIEGWEGVLCVAHEYEATGNMLEDLAMALNTGRCLPYEDPAGQGPESIPREEWVNPREAG
jgi:hypothetical protein